MATVKRSRQRDAIRSFLMSRKDHPTAEVVYDNVSKEFPNISLGTAMKLPCSDGSVHFDGNVNPHYHFQCVNCGKVMDLNFDSREVEKNFNEAAAKNFDGTIQGNVTFFYGECPECIDK
mgnify:CR=1 FL=1